MTALFEINTSNILKLIFLVGLCTSGVPLSKKHIARFSLESIIDASLPILHPIVRAGSNRCEALKSFLGLTYEQMLGRNASEIQELLHIDLITKNGTRKYNLTSVKTLTRLMTINAQTIIIMIHGFMESSDGLMVNALAPEYLKKPKLYRLMAFDGRKLISLEYFRSSTYARLMGEKLGSLLAAVVKNGVDPSRIKLVGHSLGAHIAGAAGKQLQLLTGHKVGSITALDPAGPCFTGVGPAGRLSKGDAVHVDVVHTNGGMLGLKEPVGDLDFFPNGGWSQPGCYLSTCDHSRAWELYAESINYPDRFPARKCENWTLFNEGKCSTNEVVYMGPNANQRSEGTFFLSTGPRPPFGMGPSGSG